jgi:hypothetical protein
MTTSVQLSWNVFALATVVEVAACAAGDGDDDVTIADPKPTSINAKKRSA